MIESVLANAAGSQLPIIPIPEQDWYDLRNDYLEQKKSQEPDDQKAHEEEHVEEAKKLFGEEIVEIHE